MSIKIVVDLMRISEKHHRCIPPSKGTAYPEIQGLLWRNKTKPAVAGHSPVSNKTVTSVRIEKHEEPVLKKDYKMRFPERLVLQQRN